MPDACLVNRYQAGARLTLHQDKDERDLSAPIVSVSLGISAVILFGGATRSQRPERIQLWHGDIVVRGGPSRLRYHGVLPLTIIPRLAVTASTSRSEKPAEGRGALASGGDAGILCVLPAAQLVP